MADAGAAMEQEAAGRITRRPALLVPKPSAAGLSRVSSAGGGAEMPARAENRLVINVGGVRHETYKSTLQSIPDTRLAWLTDTASTCNAEFDPVSGEYFFDRHPGMFTMILNYYRTGKLHAPMDVCGPLFEEELAFWGIDEKQLEACCWTNYRTHRDAQETLAELNGGELEDEWEDEDEDDIARRFGIEETSSIRDDHSCLAQINKKRAQLWTLLEDPANGGVPGKVMAGVSIFFILASIVLLCVETLPEARAFRSLSNQNFTLVREYLALTKPTTVLLALDVTCTAYFTLELVARLACTPSPLSFFTSVFNLIDVVALGCTYANYAMEFSSVSVTYPLVESVGLPRIIRIFKLARHFSGLKIFYHTIKASFKELFLLLVVFLIFVVMFGTTIFVIEQFQETKLNHFRHMGYGYWWALVTMTTVGYGDVVPTSLAGYLVAVFCNIVGVLVIAMPVPIIVNNFALYYTHAQARLKMPKRRRRRLVGAPDALKQQVPVDDASLDASLDGHPPREEPSPDPSDNSLRKTSEDSVSPSLDSGIKTAGSNNSSEQGGISVVFTDEPEEADASELRSDSAPWPPTGADSPSARPPADEAAAARDSSTPTRRAANRESLRRRSSMRPNGSVVSEGGRRMDPTTNRRSSFRPGLNGFNSAGSSPASARRRSQLGRMSASIPSVDIT